MKVKFDLSVFNIDTTKKEFNDYQGNTLVTVTLESILSFITKKYLFNEFETVHIHSDLFKNIAGNYRLYLNYLKDKNIIIIDESYERGLQSKGYMFSEYFKEHGFIKKISVDNIDRRIGKTQKIDVEIDPMVKERIISDFNQLCIRPEPIDKEIRFYNQENIPVINFRKYLSDVMNLSRLENTLISFKLDAGRFYTPYTQLSKTVRESHVYFDNKLVNLDIKNSFPMWLAIWLIEKGVQIDYETKEFFVEVLSGTFYSELILKFNKVKDLFNNTAFEKPRMSKQDVKEHFMTWLNGDNNRNNMVNYVFRAYYPTMFDFIRQYKRGRKDTMYYELVKMETTFIFNTICYQVYQAIPDIKLLTCHDQIYFEERFLEQVRPIWDMAISDIHLKIPAAPETDFDDSETEEFGILIDCSLQDI